MKNPISIIAPFYEALNQGGNEQLAKKVLVENWTVHPPLPGEGSDAERYLQAVKPIFAALPDFRIAILQTIAEGDFIAVRGEVTATHSGTLFGVEATHRPISYMTQDIHRIEDGKIAESWHIEDWLSVLFQIEAIKF